MYRIAFIVVAAAAIAFGLIVGTLNSDSVVVDLLWVQLEWPLGLVILLALVVGLAVGLLLLWITAVLPVRLQLNRLKQHQDRAAADSPERNHG